VCAGWQLSRIATKSSNGQGCSLPSGVTVDIVEIVVGTMFLYGIVGVFDDMGWVSEVWLRSRLCLCLLGGGLEMKKCGAVEEGLAWKRVEGL